MKVELSIKDDRELRQHILDAIKGEVLSIARGEIKSIIADAFKEKHEGQVSASVESLLKEEVRALVKSALAGQGYGEPGFIKVAAREYIEAYIKDALDHKHNTLVK